MLERGQIDAIVQEAEKKSNAVLSKEIAALAEKKKALTDEEESRLYLLRDILHDRCRTAQMEAIPLPTCCEAARKFPTIAFFVDDGDGDSNKTEGRWVTATHDKLSTFARGKFYGDHQSRWYEDKPSPTHCPYCGEALPEMRRKAKRPRGMCRVEDGGYYCSTCKERLNCCLCLPPEAAFEPVPKT